MVPSQDTTKSDGARRRGENLIHTHKDLYSYKMILFDLKNASMMYQCLVNKVFKHQIGYSMEIYVDDMLVKNVETNQHRANLIKTFNEL